MYVRRSPIWSDPRVKPPFGAAQIAWGHPLARMLHSVFLLNEGGGTVVTALGSSPVRGTFVTVATPPVWRTRREGKAPVFPGTANGEITLTPSGLFAMVAPFSCELWWDWQTADGDKGSWTGGFDNRISGQAGFQLSEEAGSTTTYRPHLVIWSGSAETNHFKATSTYSRPFNRKFLWTWDGTTAQIYVDGRSDSATTSTSTGYGSPTTIRLGGGLGSQTIAGAIQKFTIWNRVLSPSEALWLYAEPYAFLQPVIRRRRFVLAAAGVSARASHALVGSAAGWW